MNVAPATQTNAHRFLGVQSEFVQSISQGLKIGDGQVVMIDLSSLYSKYTNEFGSYILENIPNSEVV